MPLAITPTPPYIRAALQNPYASIHPGRSPLARCLHTYKFLSITSMPPHIRVAKIPLFLHTYQLLSITSIPTYIPAAIHYTSSSYLSRRFPGAFFKISVNILNLFTVIIYLLKSSGSMLGLKANCKSVWFLFFINFVNKYFQSSPSSNALFSHINFLLVVFLISSQFLKWWNFLDILSIVRILLLLLLFYPPISYLMTKSFPKIYCLFLNLFCSNIGTKSFFDFLSTSYADIIIQ